MVFYYIITEQHNFALTVKMGDSVLFLKNISKYAFSLPLSRTVRLGTEPSWLLNFPFCVIRDRLISTHFKAYRQFAPLAST